MIESALEGAIGFIVRARLSEHADKSVTVPLHEEWIGNRDIEKYLKRARDLLIAKGEAGGAWSRQHPQ